MIQRMRKSSNNVRCGLYSRKHFFLFDPSKLLVYLYYFEMVWSNVRPCGIKAKFLGSRSGRELKCDHKKSKQTNHKTINDPVSSMK